MDSTEEISIEEIINEIDAILQNNGAEEMFQDDQPVSDEPEVPTKSTDTDSAKESDPDASNTGEEALLAEDFGEENDTSDSDTDEEALLAEDFGEENDTSDSDSDEEALLAESLGEENDASDSDADEETLLAEGLDADDGNKENIVSTSHSFKSEESEDKKKLSCKDSLALKEVKPPETDYPSSSQVGRNGHEDLDGNQMFTVSDASTMTSSRNDSQVGKFKNLIKLAEDLQNMLSLLLAEIRSFQDIVTSSNSYNKRKSSFSDQNEHKRRRHSS